MTLESAMTFGEAITLPCGLRYMYDALELQSGAARRRLLNTEMLTEGRLVRETYRRLRTFYDVFAQDAPATASLRSRLASLKDIHGTTERLRASSVLDDVELFEIKALALLAAEVKEILSGVNIHDPAIPDLEAVADILDPDKMRIPSFYIYDSYSDKLAALRSAIRQGGDASGELLLQAVKIEDGIRKRLSGMLAEYAGQLDDAVETLAQTDILLAKAAQAAIMRLAFPTVSDNGSTAYSGLWHPPTAARLQGGGKTFQSIDITFANHPTVIVGTNMGGKTVTLQAVGLAQCLFQFGFGIPARSATIDPKDKVHICIGEEDLSAEGLSSFAAEIKRIDEILCAARSGTRGLAVIDEPARTTNPQEGTALVKALVQRMEGLSYSLLITTHYDLGAVEAHRLRVRGIVDGKMDYSLLEADNESVPHEALAIARTLGADPEWIESARLLIEAGKGGA